MRRKTQNPALIALHDERAKATAEFERWFSRCKRAFTRMDKARKKLARIARKIRDMETQPAKQ
jgi:hypothetical protein